MMTEGEASGTVTGTDGEASGTVAKDKPFKN